MKKRFKKIYIEITNVCNLNCSFCEKDNRNKQWMTQDQFTQILNQIKPYTDYIYLHVKGEPLLHPKINVFIDQAVEEGFQVNLTTNGTKLDHLTSKKVRQLNYSMQSTENIEQMQEIIQKLRAYSKENGTYLSLRLWTTKTKKNEEIRQMLEKEFQKEIQLVDKQALEENVFLSIEEEFKWPDLDKETEGQKIGYCYGLKDHIAILVDGTVIPCCLDHKGEVALGKIEKESLETILNKQRAKEMIEGFQNRKVVEALCQKCSFKNKFNK